MYLSVKVHLSVIPYSTWDGVRLRSSTNHHFVFKVDIQYSTLEFNKKTQVIPQGFTVIKGYLSVIAYVIFRSM